MQRYTCGFSNYTPPIPKPYVNPLEKARKKFPPHPSRHGVGGAQILLSGSLIVPGSLPVVLPTKDGWNSNRSTNLKGKPSYPFVVVPESKLGKVESVVLGMKLQVTLSSAAEVKAGKPVYAIGVLKQSTPSSPSSPSTRAKSHSSPKPFSSPKPSTSPKPSSSTHSAILKPESLPSHNPLNRSGLQFSSPSAYAIDRATTKYVQHHDLPAPKLYIPLHQKYAKKTGGAKGPAKAQAQVLFSGAVIVLPPLPVALPTKSAWNQGRAQNLKGKPSFDFVPQPAPPKEESVKFGDHVLVKLSSLEAIKKGGPAFVLGGQ